MEKSKATAVQLWSIKSLARKLGMTDNELGERSRQLVNRQDLDVLTISEADELKRWMQQQYGEQLPTFRRMMAKAIGTAETALGYKLYSKSPDWKKFNAWMRHKSTVKTALYDCSIKELTAVISQLDQIAMKR